MALPKHKFVRASRSGVKHIVESAAFTRCGRFIKPHEWQELKGATARAVPLCNDCIDSKKS